MSPGLRLTAPRRTRGGHSPSGDGGSGGVWPLNAECPVRRDRPDTLSSRSSHVSVGDLGAIPLFDTIPTVGHRPPTLIGRRRGPTLGYGLEGRRRRSEDGSQGIC
ncbi:hypothetical protein GCM10027176_31190 [Actinoallomurus bryophytorum]